MMTVPVPMRFRTDAAGGNGPVRVDPGRGHPHHYPVAAAIRRHGKGTAAITYAFTDTPSAGSRYRLPPWPIPLEPETTGGARIAKRQAWMNTALPAGSETARPSRLLSADPGQAWHRRATAVGQTGPRIDDTPS